MADPLLETLLGKATGIGPAPPANTETLRTLLNGGIDLFKGATGLGDQGPAGPTPTNLGAILGAASPLAGALPRRAGPDAAEALIKMLLKVEPAAEADISTMAARKFLEDRATPRMGLPPQKLNIPQVKESPTLPLASTDRYNEWQANLGGPRPTSAPLLRLKPGESLGDVVPPAKGPTVPPPPLFVKGRTGGQSRGVRGRLTEDMVRDIRQIGSLGKASQKYPDMSEAALNDVLRGGSWAWVK